MKHKVLLVEDDKMTVKVLSVRLKAKGYEVIVAFDAVMALAQAKEHKPDVILYNSGGALVAMDGRLIGINTALFSRSGESNGLGFAIPSNMVGAVLKAALSGGRLVRHWFGARGRVVDVDVAESLGLQRPGGVVIEEIYAGGPADYAGIRPGDVILKVN
ncbi:MAG: PDZ domain-containing protein, partial [Nitrospirota bacterium]|nr:PDZ domain-containing protein [Nitrospirota bacterium]